MPPPMPGGGPPPPPSLKAVGTVAMAAATWGDKRSKPMHTLNWDKLPQFKAGKTIFATGGAASGLESLLGGGKLELDVSELEGLFARPEAKAKAAAPGDDRPRVTKVQLLEQKRSTSVGIVMKRVTDALKCVTRSRSSPPCPLPVTRSR